jgi:enamine deaminase RidA (YjgF/YER057c/UK114 family)
MGADRRLLTGRTGRLRCPRVGHHRHRRPATSMVEVSRLISPEILVEIEADAVIEESGA